MSSSEQPVRIALRNVDDLVGVVPYLLGFHPQESLVILVLEDERVVVSVRLDLEAAACPAVLDDLLVRVFGRFPAAKGWFLAYTDNDDLAWEVLAMSIELAGVVRLGRVLQVGRQWWRTDCPDGPFGAISAVSTVAVEATVLGLSALASRTELAGRLAGSPDAEVEWLLEEFAAGSTELQSVGSRGRRRLLRRLTRTGEPHSREEYVRLALLADHPDGQPMVLRSLAEASAGQQVWLWTQVLRHCLSPQRPAVLGVLGLAAWLAGDGAFQIVCLEELERSSPGAPIAGLLRALNREVVPPNSWEAVREPLLTRLSAEVARTRDPRGCS